MLNLINNLWSGNWRRQLKKTKTEWEDQNKTKAMWCLFVYVFFPIFSCFTNALLFLYSTQKKYVGQNHVISETMSATPHPMSFGNSRVSLSQQLSLVLVVDTYGG